MWVGFGTQTNVCGSLVNINIAQFDLNYKIIKINQNKFNQMTKIDSN